MLLWWGYYISNIHIFFKKVSDTGDIMCNIIINNVYISYDECVRHLVVCGTWWLFLKKIILVKNARRYERAKTKDGSVASYFFFGLVCMKYSFELDGGIKNWAFTIYYHVPRCCFKAHWMRGNTTREILLNK